MKTQEPNNQVLTDKYALYNGDCVSVMKGLPDGFVDLSVYSPPFTTKRGGCLYQYSSDAADLSNSIDGDEFFNHYQFVIRELHRLTKPGRMTAVHCMDVPLGNSGCDSIYDFPGDIIRLHEAYDDDDSQSFYLVLDLCQGGELFERIKTQRRLNEALTCAVVQQILRALRRSPREAENELTLGYGADDTAGNARETAEWMAREKLASLILVTSNFHMPRALLEFHAAMPDVDIIPRATAPAALRCIRTEGRTGD